jgi:putative hemolysin
MSLFALGLLFALLFLLVCSGFFSSSETVFFSLNPLQIRRISKKHPAGGEHIRHILSTPTRLLSTVLIGNTIVNVAAANVGFVLAEHFSPRYGEAVSIPVMTLLLLLFGEIGPKRLGFFYSETLALLFAPIITLMTPIMTPLRIVLEKITQRLEPLFRPHGKTLSEEEFETVLEISNEEGILNADELAMIKAIIRLEDLKASDVMTPRVDLIGFDLNDPPSIALEKARQSKKNFLLLYRDQFDNVDGFLDVRKFLLDPEHRIETARVPPFYVPESSPLNRLLSRFQKERRRIAVVVDEYGGTAGIMTRGDILEEISGEIYNELSKPRPLFQNAGPHRWLVDANISLEELNRKLRLHLEAEGVDRLSGWIAAKSGHMPQPGDILEEQGTRITVLQTIKLRVTLAQIERVGEGGGE